jgi:hypothetical protein
MKRSPTHGLALFFAAFPLVGSAFVALAGSVWGMGLQCDENCTGDDWQHTAGAPQWTVLAVMALVVFVSGIALFAFVYRSRPWQALAALACGTTALVSALSFWGTDWNDEFRRHPLTFGALAAILLSGALAAFLSAPADNAAPDTSDHPRDTTSVRARNWITWLFVALGALCVFWVLGEIWFAVTQSR